MPDAEVESSSSQQMPPAPLAHVASPETDPGGSFSAATRHARTAVAALFFVNGMTVGSWVPHIPDRAHDLGLNAAQLGSVMLAGGLGCVAAMPLSSTLTARFGSRRVATVGGLCFPAMLAVAVFAPTVPWLVVSLILLGLAGASMDISMNAHGVLVEKRLGRRTISLFHGLFSAGGVVGSALTSMALEHRLPRLWTVLPITLLCACIVLAANKGLLHEDRLPVLADAETPRGSLLDRLRAMVPHHRLLLVGVLTFSAMIAEGSVGDWSGLLLRVTRGLGDGVVGYGFTCFSATMVLGRFSGDYLVARIGEVWALRLGGLMGVAGLLLVLESPALPLVLAGFAVMGVGLANCSPILYRAAGRIEGVPANVGIAIVVGIGYVGLLAGPPALGYLGHTVGLRSIFFLVMALCAMVATAAPLVRGASMRQVPLGDPVSAEPVI